MGKATMQGTLYFCLLHRFLVSAMLFKRRLVLTSVNAQCSDIVDKVVVDHRNERWVDRKQEMLQSEIEEFKCFVERLFALQCSFGNYCRGFHLLN